MYRAPLVFDVLWQTYEWDQTFVRIHGQPQEFGQPLASEETEVRANALAREYVRCNEFERIRLGLHATPRGARSDLMYLLGGSHARLVHEPKLWIPAGRDGEIIRDRYTSYGHNLSRYLADGAVNTVLDRHAEESARVIHSTLRHYQIEDGIIVIGTGAVLATYLAWALIGYGTGNYEKSLFRMKLRPWDRIRVEERSFRHLPLS